MKDIHEAEEWLENCIRDMKAKLELEDSDIAWLLLKHGTNHYFKSITRCGQCPQKHRLE